MSTNIKQKVQSRKQNVSTESAKAEMCGAYLLGSPIASNPLSLHAGSGTHIAVECGEASSTPVVKPNSGQSHESAQ